MSRLRGLHPTEAESAYAAEDSPSTDEEASEQTHQRRKRRKRDGQAQMQLPPGERDHLFFSIMPNAGSHAAKSAESHSPSLPAAAASLCIWGTQCVLHPDSAVAASIRDETHLQELDASSLHHVSPVDDELVGPPAPLPPHGVRVDRYDVRVMLPPVEWRYVRAAESESDEEGEDIDSAIDPRPQDAATDGDLEVGEATDADLQRERMSAGEFTELQQERYRDWWDSRGRPSEDTASASSPVAEKNPALELAAALAGEEVDESADAAEVRKRQLMAEKGRVWQYTYTDADTGSTPAQAMPAAAALAPSRRPPPPPPRKRGPPPPPPRVQKAPMLASSSDVSVSAPPPTDPPFHPSFPVPPGLLLPLTLSEHRVIAHTAEYIRSQGAAGGQQEVLLRIKQQDNARMWFINADHPLFAYYTFIKQNPHLQHIEAPHTQAAEAASAMQPPANDTPVTAAAAAIAAAAPAAERRATPPGMRAPPGMRKSSSSDSMRPVEYATSQAAAAPVAVAAVTDSVPVPSTSLFALAAYGDSDEDEDAPPTAASAPVPAPRASLPMPPPPPSTPAPMPVSLPLPPPPPVLPIPSSLLPLLPPAPTPIPPPSMLRAIHKLCSYLHRHGPSFERLTAARERNNPLFAFLTDPSSTFRPYYEWARFIQPMVAEEEKLQDNIKAKAVTDAEAEASPTAASPTAASSTAAAVAAPSTSADPPAAAVAVSPSVSPTVSISASAADRMVAEAKARVLAKLAVMDR